MRLLPVLTNDEYVQLDDAGIQVVVGVTHGEGEALNTEGIPATSARIMLVWLNDYRFGVDDEGWIQNLHIRCYNRRQLTAEFEYRLSNTGIAGYNLRWSAGFIRRWALWRAKRVLGA